MQTNYHVPDPDTLSTNPPCAAPCGAELTAGNLINSDTVHQDCRCSYRDCRVPLLTVLDWTRGFCPACWEAGGDSDDPDLKPTFTPCKQGGDKPHDVTTVKLRKLPEMP
jgi:hypothetical protein